MSKSLLIFSVLLVSIVSSPHAATAQDLCWAIDSFEHPCTGSGGCNDSYLYSYCIDGCARGICENHGGSGLCCGHLYYSAVIYVEGEQNCGGQICGDAPVRGSDLRPSSEHNALQALARDRLPGSDWKKHPHFAWYRPSRLVLVPDSCAHTYGVVIQSLPSPVGE